MRYPRSTTTCSLMFSGRARVSVWTAYFAGRVSRFQARPDRPAASSTSFGIASIPNRNRTPSPSQRSRCRVELKSVSPRSRIRSNPAARHSAIA